MAKVGLTDAFAAKAEPGLYWDADNRAPGGFGLRVTAAGSRAWFLNYLNHDGVERRITIGQVGSRRLAAARKKAAELRRIVEDGGDPLADRQARRAAPTIAELVERYCADPAFTKRRPDVQGHYRNALDRYVLPRFGKKKVADLTRADVKKLHADISGKGTPCAANAVVVVLRLVINVGIKEWQMRPPHDNPASGIEFNPEEKRQRFVKPHELSGLCVVLNQRESGQPDVVDAIRLLLMTGARRAEVIDARWGQFDLDDNASWEKPASVTKDKKNHHIPIAVDARDLLRRRRATRGNVVRLDDRVFPSLTVGRLTYQWEQLREAAGLPGLRLHDLRHSFASFAVSRGATLPLIGALLGHSEVRTTARYAHLLDQPMRELVDGVGKLVGAGQ